MSGARAERRRTRFHARIHTEREILRVINSSATCENFPLAGMTSSAIDAWERRAREVFEDGWAAKVGNTLREIGRRCELLADDSRDVFRPTELIDHEDVETATTALREILAKAAARSRQT